MNIHYRLVACALLALLTNADGLADEPVSLLHNPFSRPPSLIIRASNPVIEKDGTVRTLDLRATMVSKTDRLANVAGRTLRPGDEVQGYTLLQVFEDRAVFSRAGARLTVYVKPELVDDDEE
ncbi:MAG: hypothetical protein OEY74_08070 [Gammaproteobacteria bacterium]|nr:hypothetical protein [Gammaproteobacteria bacterium]